MSDSTASVPLLQPRCKSPGSRLREAVQQEQPLQVVGAVSAYCAQLAKRAGFRALYLSGAGVANSSFGLPDLGITTMPDVAEEIRRISDACDLPLLVDADTGFGPMYSIARTTREFIRAGAAGMHLEDQPGAKRCGHRPGKMVVDADEMTDRIRAAVDARDDPGFVIMARTDAVAVEGLSAALQRCHRYRDAGADMIFVEAITDLENFRQFTQSLGVPVLANMTEFGRTPLTDLQTLRQLGIALVLYPLSAFRAMSAAAQNVYNEIRIHGDQRGVLHLMQTRDELYEVIQYHAYEQQIDEFLRKAQT